MHPKRVPYIYRYLLGGHDKVVIQGGEGGWFAKAMAAETVDLVYTPESWKRLQEPFRNIRLFTFGGWISSDVIRRLVFPDLAFLGTWSLALCWYNQKCEVGIELPSELKFHPVMDFTLHSKMICIPHEPFMLLGTAIALLVSFRTNTSFGRFNEGRHLWGTTMAVSREICGRVLARIPTPRANKHKRPDVMVARIHGAKLAMSFPHTLKYHLTVNGCNMDFSDDEDHMEQKRARLLDELKLIWDWTNPKERTVVERILRDDVFNWPIAVCQELTHLNGNYYVAPHPGGLGHPNSNGLDNLITTLQQITADSERILQTPIYTPYTRFTNRVIYVYCSLFPAILYPLMGPVMTTPIALFLSFVFLGIDDIGRRVEEPFDNMPLWQFVHHVDRSCEQLLYNAYVLER